MCPMRSRDCVHIVFVCHWVAHTRREGMGDCTYTVDTIYEHDIKISEPLSLRSSDYYACTSDEGGGQSPFSPKPLGTKIFNTLVHIVLV